MTVLVEVSMYLALAIIAFVVGVVLFALVLGGIMALSDFCCNTNLFRKKHIPDTGYTAPTSTSPHSRTSRFEAERNESELHMCDPMTSYPTPDPEHRRSRLEESSPMQTDIFLNVPEPRILVPQSEFPEIHIDVESDLPPSYNEAVNNSKARHQI